MRKPYTEPRMMVEVFEDLVATGGPHDETGSGEIWEHSKVIDDEEEY